MNQIKLGALISYFSVAINLLIGLLYTPWMIHSLGKEDYGLFILATSVITLFVFDFGLGNAVTRFVAKYIAEGDTIKINRFLGLVVRLYFIIDVILFICLVSVYFLIPYIYQELTVTEIEKFKVVYVVAASFSVISFPFIPLDGIISAYEKFVQLKLCDLFNKLFIVITMAICLLLGYGLYALVTVNVVAGILTILMKIVVVKKYINILPNLVYRSKSELKSILGYSGWVTITALSQRLIFNIAPSIIGIVSGSVEIAFFGIASSFEGYIFSIANALNGLFLPRVTKLSTQNEDILILMIKIARIQIVIISLLLLGFIALGNDFITLWLGIGYESVYMCVILLIIPSFFYLPKMIANNAVLAQNLVKKQALVFMIMGVFNLLVGYLLAENFGALGFSLSIFFAYMIRAIGMDIIFYKDLKLPLKNFYRESYFSMIIPLCLLVLITVFIFKFWTVNSWIYLLLKAMAFTTIYACVVYYWIFNSTEKTLLFSLVGRKLMNK